MSVFGQNFSYNQFFCQKFGFQVLETQIVYLKIPKN